jgi:hypothetical protein
MIHTGLKTRGVSGGVRSNGRCFRFQGERGFGEDGADMWVPPGSEREREEVGRWAGLAAGPVLLRVGPVGCCLFFSLFLCYFFFFITFA